MRSHILPLLFVLILNSALLAVTKQIGVHDGFRVHKRSRALKAAFDYKQTDRGSITRRQHFRSKAELMAQEPSRTEAMYRRQAQTSPEVRVYDLCSARPNVAGYTTIGPYARYGQAVARGVNVSLLPHHDPRLNSGLLNLVSRSSDQAAVFHSM